MAGESSGRRKRTLESTESVATVTPRYLAMAAQLRERIASGDLASGDRLPSFSEMRQQFGATVATVERIYGLLEKEGLLERRQGVGTFVARPRASNTGEIGLLGVDLKRSQQFAYYSDLLEGMQAAADQAGRHLLLLGGPAGWNAEAAAKVDGLVVFNFAEAATALREVSVKRPYVCVMTTGAGASSVVADDYGGGKLATEHLISLGHRRIACLMEKRPQVVRLRLAGYAEALMEAGIEAEANWIFSGSEFTYLPREARPSYLDWGRQNMRSWLEGEWAETGCTAIFAQNDMVASGVVQVLQDAGLKVPRDVSVVGFDGTELTDFCQPRLTSVRVPLEAIGAEAVRMLLMRMENPELEGQSKVLPVRLKEGESTGTARGSR